MSAATKRYQIRNALGDVLAVHVRHEGPNGKKVGGMPWELPDGTSGLDGLSIEELPLYGSERLEGWDREAPVFLVEGEKAADALSERGYKTLATVCGASSTPSPDVLSILAGRHVVTWPDADDAGRKHMERVEAILRPIIASLRRLEWYDVPKADAADFFETYTEAQLDEWLAQTPEPVTESPPVDPDGGPERTKTLQFAEFLSEQSSDGESLWGDLLVFGGGYFLLGGDGEVGKTILLDNLALSLANGEADFLGFKLPGRPVRVLLFFIEGSRTKNRDRLRRLAELRGIDPPAIPLSVHRAEVAPTLGEVEAMIKETRAEVCILDPLNAFFDGNENFTSEWRRGVTAPLRRLTQLYGTAFAFSDHYVKPAAKAADRQTGSNKVRGARAKRDDCGGLALLEYGAGGKAERVLIIDRVRDGGKPEPNRFRLTVNVADALIALDERPGPMEDVPTEDVRVADVVKIIRARGNGAEVKTADLIAALMERFEIGDSQAEELKGLAVKTGKIEKVRRGWYRLPGEVLS